MAKPVRIVFETHSLTVDNEAGRATGWLAGRLSERGRGLAAELGARRRNDGVAAVYTSDLGRAVETSEIALSGSGIPVIQDPRLRECNYGRLNGSPTAYLGADGPMALDQPYPDGESWRQAIGRVIGFLEELEETRGGERILVIGHMSAWYALESRSKHLTLDQAVARPMRWQPGWEYTLPPPGRDAP